MVYGIIQRHGGTIAIESELGAGSTFSIHLPMTEQAAVNDSSKRQAESASVLLHVLVVDDEPRVAQTISDYLTIDGHTVEIAHDGLDALEKFHQGWFDLVVTDLAMPGMSGDGLAGTIKQIAPNQPIILLTGFGDMMKASGEKPASVDIIVSKPVTLTTFREALNQVGAKPLQHVVDHYKGAANDKEEMKDENHTTDDDITSAARAFQESGPSARDEQPNRIGEKDSTSLG